MIFKYSFPVPQHGEIRSTLVYAHSDKNPTKNQIRRLLEKLKLDAGNLHNWARMQDIDKCMFALDNILSNWPRLPLGSIRTMPVVCKTPLGQSSIQVSLVDAHSIPSAKHYKR